MPSAIFDSDRKYTNLVEICKDLNKTNDHSNSQSNNALGEKCQIFENVFDALDWLTDSSDPTLESPLKNKNLNCAQIKSSDKKINVLVTGSLYLVGLSLKVLNFKIN